MGANVAVIDCVPSHVTWQMLGPAHAPDQPMNMYPGFGTACIGTTVPTGTRDERAAIWPGLDASSEPV
jgi:hypothetical protein